MILRMVGLYGDSLTSSAEGEHHCFDEGQRSTWGWIIKLSMLNESEWRLNNWQWEINMMFIINYQLVSIRSKHQYINLLPMNTNEIIQHIGL